MLRRMVFKNFIHFKERQFLDFAELENEPIFFVGASSTGKTAALELIRRCLDSKLNSSLTARTSPDSIAYIFCEFIIELNDYDPTVITGVLVESKQMEKTNGAKQEDKNHRETEDKEISDDEEGEDETFNNEESYDDKNDTMFHKVIIYRYKGEKRVRYETFLEKPSPYRIVPFRSTMKLRTRQSETLDDMIKRDNFAKEILSDIRTDLPKEKKYRKKNILLREISQTFVGILSMRGIGTFQWTRSKKISPKCREENYKSTCTQAEIITDLLDSDLVDKSKAEGIFRYLTDGKNIEFKKASDGSITVIHDKKEFPLLKTSVGILEAEQFSLLMAYQDMKTICLEEPDRGMHPHMIHCMNVVLYEESRNKRIIVVTHSPYLIDSFWCQNIFYFNRDDILSMTSALSKQSTDTKSEDGKTQKKPKYVEHEDWKTLLFSSKVLLVEGKTDKRVLQSLFRHLFTNSTSKTLERNRKILSHQIFFCNGSQGVKKVKETCGKLNITCRDVLDMDAVITKDDQGLIKRIEEKGFEFFWDPSTQISITEFLEKEFIYENDNWRCIEDEVNSTNKNQPFQKLSDDLRKKNTFIWKEGDLEDVLLSESQKDICDALQIPEYKTKTKDDLKKAIKDTLSADPSKQMLEKLSKTIIKFKAVVRLMNFLGDL